LSLGFGALSTRRLLKVREGVIVIACAQSSPMITTLKNISLILQFYRYILEIQTLAFKKEWQTDYENMFGTRTTLFS